MVVAKRKDGTVEIKDLDDLLRVLKEVRADEEPLILQEDGGNEIVLNPRAPRGGRRTRRERAGADYGASLSAAGSWEGLIVPDEFMRQVREGCSSNRPLVVLDPPDLDPPEE